ncbi:MAG TPA: hypothetical protein DCX27_07435 [Balneola sp.]|nr:hypothetical protein [Balneola sp.]
MSMKVKNRSDLHRDENTGALIYETDKNVSTRNEVKKLKKEIHSLKSNVEDIKTLLERVINGR